MIRQAIIRAGGLGTRMAPITDIIPKPMVEINGRTLIERIIDDLINAGVTSIVIDVFYKKDMLKDFLLSKYSSRSDVKLIILEEEQLPGTAGAVIHAIEMGYIRIDEPLFFSHSDYVYIGMTPNELSDFAEVHSEKESDVTLLLQDYCGKIMGMEIPPITHQIYTGEPHKITSFHWFGFGIINPRLFEKYELDKESLFMSQCFHKVSQDGRMFGKIFNGYAFNIDRQDKLLHFTPIITQLENSYHADEVPLHHAFPIVFGFYSDVFKNE